MFKNRLIRFSVFLLVGFAVSGCQIFQEVKEKRKIDYQTSRRLPSLEIPRPDGSAGGQGQPDSGRALDSDLLRIHQR